MLMTFSYIWIGRAGVGREQRWKQGQDAVDRERHARTAGKQCEQAKSK